MTTQFVWTALPNGVDADYAYFSLFLSPRLSGGATLADFPFSPSAAGLPAGTPTNWAFFAQFLSVQAVFSSGAMVQAERLTSSNSARAWADLDTALWNAIFPPTTPVDDYAFVDYSSYDMRTFSVRDTLATLDSMYNAVALRGAAGFPALDDPDLPVRVFVPIIDYMLGRFRNPNLSPSTPPIDPNDDAIASAFSSVFSDPTAQQIAYHFYRAYRFYRRENRTVVDQYADINPAMVPPPPVVPAPSFHTLLGMLGDHPTLLRKLGLVTDYRMRRALVPTTGAFSVLVGGQFPLSVDQRALQTSYEITSNGFFAAADALSDIREGMLLLSPNYYDVVQVDVDGAVLKSIGFATSASSLLKEAVSTMRPAPKESLPARRTGGITIARHERGSQLAALLARASARNAKLAANDPADPVVLGAGDTYRGFRVDVLADNGNWYSLCRREGSDIVASTPVALSPRDLEGYVKGSATSSGSPHASAAEQKTLYVHDAVVGWDGWSLCARKPGRGVGYAQGDAAQAPIVGFLGNDAAPGYVITSDYKATRGTLPRLRFGKQYQFRARVVDLAGNSLPYDTTIPDFGWSSPKVTYLRYEPVAAPTFVQRRTMTEGESLETIVIRSNPEPVDDLSTLALGTNASAYASTPIGSTSGYFATNDRHVAPPKAAQAMVETMGLLDGLTPQQAFNVSVKEAGTFLDNAVYDIDTGALTPLPAGAVQLLDPKLGVVPLPTVRGAPLGQGQYTVHPNDQLVLPYLPDPLASGATFATPAGALSMQAYAVGPHGAWPDLLPFRLVLSEATTLAPSFAQNVGTFGVGLAPGAALTLQYSSTPDPKHIEKMAVWKALVSGGALEADLILAKSGVNWTLSPSREVALVHAVQRPLVHPKMQKAIQVRNPGETFVTLHGEVANDGRSTGHIEMNASWKEWVDLLGEDGPRQVEHQAHAFTLDVRYEETATTIGFRAGRRHELGDTKHRWIDYSPDGTTRYREFFPAALTADPVNLTTPGRVTRMSVPASARPEAPKVLYIVPTFRWEESDGGSTKTRVGRGLRVYLDRPWYSSGDDELLGVLVASSQPVGEEAAKYISEWGNDPVWAPSIALAPLSEDDFENRVKNAPPDGTTPLATGPFSLAESPNFDATVVAFNVAYSADRKLWYCDIELAPTDAYMPFIRLALARYQPYAVGEVGWGQSELHLSRVVRTEFLQVLPDRSVTVTAAGAGTVNVAVAGISGVNAYGVTALKAPVPSVAMPSGGNVSGVARPKPMFSVLDPRAGAGHRVTTQVERRPQGSSNDLLWVAVGGPAELPSYAQSFSAEVAWSGPVRLPAFDTGFEYRIVVREAEVYQTDSGVADSSGGGVPTADRVMFVAAFPLRP